MPRAANGMYHAIRQKERKAKRVKVKAKEAR
jgi:hypothetical protein